MYLYYEEDDGEVDGKVLITTFDIISSNRKKGIRSIEIYLEIISTTVSWDQKHIL